MLKKIQHSFRKLIHPFIHSFIFVTSFHFDCHWYDTKMKKYQQQNNNNPNETNENAVEQHGVPMDVKKINFSELSMPDLKHVLRSLLCLINQSQVGNRTGTESLNLDKFKQSIPSHILENRQEHETIQKCEYPT